MMKLISQIFKLMNDDDYRFRILSKYGILNHMDDQEYIERMFEIRTGNKLNLQNPQTFNEKLQWLKLHDRNPIYTTMVDKYEAKRFASDIIGEEHIIQTLGVWDKFDDIDFNALPDQFVLKCTHDSGGLIICKDKSKLDMEAAKEKINKCLKRNYFYYNREWPYKNVTPRIIAERYMESNDNSLRDYKFFNFNGNTKFVYVSEGLEDHTTAKISFYDLEGNCMPFRRLDYADFDESIQFPSNFKEMLQINQKLVGEINADFVRTDFYSINDSVFFSEITFFPCGGYVPFDPKEWDKTLGEWLEIPVENGGGGYCLTGENWLIWLHHGEVQKTPNEFQFWCINGKPQFVSAIIEPHGVNLKASYDLCWNRLPFVTSLPVYEMEVLCPKYFQEMSDIAEKLSSNCPFLRVDFMIFNSEYYLGEMTLYPAGGIVRWNPSTIDLEFGTTLELPSIREVRS